MMNYLEIKFENNYLTFCNQGDDGEEGMTTKLFKKK